MSKKRKMQVVKREETTFDKILAHYIDPDLNPLTDDQEKIRKRWAEIFTLRQNHFSPSMIVKKWKRDHGIEMAQAYVDIKNSESLFGSVTKASKEGLKNLWLHWIQDYLLRCIQNGDRKSEGVAYKLIAEYADFKGDDSKDFNIDKFVNKEIHIHVNDSVKQRFVDMLGKGSVDLNNLDVTDIPYEDLDQDHEQAD